MIDVADRDWELLNAYADGELPAADVAAFEARLAAEPALMVALEQIREISGALSGYIPAEPPVAENAPMAQPAPQPAPTNRNWRPVALAASVALAAVITGATLLWPNAELGLSDHHAAFLENSYTLENPVQPVGGFTRGFAPDLELASLYLVDQKSLAEGTALAHYTGRNNCRLTLLATPVNAMPTLGAQIDGPQVSQWLGQNTGYTIMASGMDARRFNAIADYMKRLTLQGDENADMLAVRMATDAAAPCAQA